MTDATNTDGQAQAERAGRFAAANAIDATISRTESEMAETPVRGDDHDLTSMTEAEHEARGAYLDGLRDGLVAALGQDFAAWLEAQEGAIDPA